MFVLTTFLSFSFFLFFQGVLNGLDRAEDLLKTIPLVVVLPSTSHQLQALKDIYYVIDASAFNVYLVGSA